MDRDMSSRRGSHISRSSAESSEHGGEEDEEEDDEDEVAIPRPLAHRLARLELVFAECYSNSTRQGG